MMDVNRQNGLAVTGMDVVLPGCDGLEAYGRSVYRGLPLEGQFKSESDVRAAACRMTQRTLKELGLSAGQVSAVTLLGSLAEVVKILRIGGRVRDASSDDNPLASALASARGWLVNNDTEAVLLLERRSEAVSAVVLSLEDPFAQPQRQAYAVIEDIAAAANHRSQQDNPGGAKMANSDPRPETFGLLVAPFLTGAGISSPEERSTLSLFGSAGEPTCALSASPGGLLGLVKTAWCLSRRVIPGTPGWSGPDQPEGWQDTPFYVPVDSRTWFTNDSQEVRRAGYILSAVEGASALVVLREAPGPKEVSAAALNLEPLRIFPVAAPSVEQLLERMKVLSEEISSSPDYSEASRRCYAQFLRESGATQVTACLLAQTADGLSREISFALKGIPSAAEKGTDWQTPQGSFFSTHPLGGTGKVAFVYPGAFNSYPGVGQDLFYLFPSLYERFALVTRRAGELLQEKKLYPRSLSPLTPAQLADFEAALTADPTAMLISGTSLAVLYTYLLRDIFGIGPAGLFGYSLGEISMMFAGDVWTGADDVSAALLASPLFHTRLAGPQDAVREYWKVKANGREEPLWENYLLMTTADKVSAALAYEPRVYLTHINTPRQVVIGGDPEGCHRVIDTLKCSSLQAPFNYALHNEAVQSEFGAMQQLLTWPVNRPDGVTFYSAAAYQPMAIDSAADARLLAKGLCSCLDFPRLVRQVYQDGSRIFVELGAGGNCARWIDETLHGQPHVAFSINRKGVDDYTSILRLLARLICHRVPVNLSPLYNA